MQGRRAAAADDGARRADPGPLRGSASRARAAQPSRRGTRAAIATLLAPLALGLVLAGCGAEGQPQDAAERAEDSASRGRDSRPDSRPDPRPHPRPPSRPPSRPHHGEFSADAHPEIFESLRADLEAPRHAADGGGRAWIAGAWEVHDDGAREAARNPDGEPVFRAGSPARISLVYEVGSEGVAADGVVFLQVSPFWEWDEPQPLYEDAAGYTRIHSEARGVKLEPVAFSGGLLAIEVKGRALEPGEQIELVYGAGPLGARVDRYAERRARLWFAVDGDADGVRALVQDSPTVEIQPREAAHLIATLSTTAAPGEAVSLTLAVLDAVGNAGVPFEGEVELETQAGLELPTRVRLRAEDRGRKRLEGRAQQQGTFRVRARAQSDRGPLEAESNPLRVRAGLAPVLWGDLHGHSQLSDGTGTPDDYYDYARHVAALDVAALTDHDHWGMRFLDAHPELWDEIRDAATRHHEPGRFVTLLGYEWTSWLQGHRHILYFSDDGEVLSSLDPAYQTPDALWAALRGKPALTFAHHSAGGPISTNWSWAPPEDLEPVTEIASVHGSSEADDSPSAIYNPVPGNFVRDVLGVGYRFGFIGSGDSHDGHPGLAGIATRGVSGLAAIRARERTRAAVLEALRARRTYATSGPRIFLETTLEDLPSGLQRLRTEVAAVAGVERVDFIRTGLVATVPRPDDKGESGPEGAARARDFAITREIPPLAPGEFVYVRVVQSDGGLAWSSPFYGPRLAE